MTVKQIKSLMIENITTETLLRQWQRRLIVALTAEEKQKCKAKIKEYANAKSS